jgi:hypothetical protein
MGAAMKFTAVKTAKKHREISALIDFAGISDGP